MEEERQPGAIDTVRLEQLIKLIEDHKIWPKKLFVVGKKTYAIIGQKQIDRDFSMEDYEIIIPRNFSRGDILDSFSKIEFFINEIFRVAIMKSSQDSRNESFNKILEKLNFNTKFRMLVEDLKIIDRKNKVCRKINSIRKIRNTFAHLWNIDKVYYKSEEKGYLRDNFKEFQEDLREAWKELIRIYEGLINQDLLIEKAIEEIEEKVAHEKENEEVEEESVRISPKEYYKMIEEIKNDHEEGEDGRSKDAKQRYLVAIALAAESGLKVKEILSLTGENIKNNFIIIENEGARRTVPAPKTIGMEIIKETIPLTVGVRTLQKGLRKYGREFLGKDGITLSGLRSQCFFEISREEGLSLGEIKKRLGISSWSSIESYT